MIKKVVAVGISLFVTAPAVNGAQWTVDFLGSPKFGYDDNVLLSEDKEDSFTLNVSPTISLGRAVENMVSSVDLGYSIERFTSISRLDSENPFIRFKTNYMMERTEFGLDASYVEDSTRNEAEEDTGNFSSDATSRTRAISPSVRYQLTEKDTLRASYSYSETEYSGDDFGDFDDSDSRTVTVGWTRQLTERLSGGLTGSASNYKTQGLTSSTDDDSYNLSTYLGYQLSQVWFIDANVGYRRLNTKTKQNSGTTETGSSTGSTFDLSTTYEQEVDTVSLRYTKQLSPSSSGAVNEQDSVILDWSHALSEYLTANLSASYRETRTASEQLADEKRENINISPSLRWQLDSKLGIDFGYHFKQQKRDDSRDTESNAVSVTVIYDWDGYRMSR